VTRIILAIVLLLTLAMPPAIRKPSCYITGNARAQACICGGVAVPMLFCKARR